MVTTNPDCLPQPAGVLARWPAAPHLSCQRRALMEAWSEYVDGGVVAEERNG